MPHQVVKCSVRGSVGDLAKITAALEADGLTSSPPARRGEPPRDHRHALRSGPDKIRRSFRPSRTSSLGPGRTPEDVEAFPDVHILLNDAPGQLRRAVEALGDINIETVARSTDNPETRPASVSGSSRATSTRQSDGYGPPTSDPRPQALAVVPRSALRARLPCAHPHRRSSRPRSGAHAQLGRGCGSRGRWRSWG